MLGTGIIPKGNKSEFLFPPFCDYHTISFKIMVWMIILRQDSCFMKEASFTSKFTLCLSQLDEYFCHQPNNHTQYSNIARTTV